MSTARESTSLTSCAIPPRPTIRLEITFPPRSPEYLQANMQPEWADQILQYVHDGEIVVPPDKYFAMGDNRDHSWDSRFWGFVDRDAIMGRPVVIYWSVQETRGRRNGPDAEWVVPEHPGYDSPSAFADPLVAHVA